MSLDESPKLAATEKSYGLVHVLGKNWCSIHFFSQNDIKYSSTNNWLAAGQFSFILHHFFILHGILLAADAMQIYILPEIWPAVLTFPSYHSVWDSSDSSPSQQEFIKQHWDFCKISAMKIVEDKKWIRCVDPEHFNKGGTAKANGMHESMQ